LQASPSGLHLSTSNLTHALIITHRHVFYSCGGYYHFHIFLLGGGASLKVTNRKTRGLMQNWNNLLKFGNKALLDASKLVKFEMEKIWDTNKGRRNFMQVREVLDRLCGLMVKVSVYRSEGP
jgi:hypothetical protein